VFPYFWIATTSLKDLAGLSGPPSLLPVPPHWENYVQAWQSGPFLRYLINNIITTFGILVIQLFLACLAAYAFSKLSFPGRDVCFFVVISCLMVPPQIRFLPIYIMLAKVGLLNTYSALILPTPLPRWEPSSSARPSPVSATTCWMRRGSMGRTCSRSSSASWCPSQAPIIAFSLFSVVYHWNDYFWPS